MNNKYKINVISIQFLIKKDFLFNCFVLLENSDIYIIDKIVITALVYSSIEKY